MELFSIRIQRTFQLVSTENNVVISIVSFICKFNVSSMNYNYL